MRALVQKVNSASVKVENEKISEIAIGYLVLLGIKDTDTENELNYVCEKLSNLRVFEDNEGKMNLSIKDVNGEILVVSQFTLYADTKRGNRPSFTDAARPEKANDLYEKFCLKLENLGLKVKKGKFQAMMDVELVNSGPVTVMIEK